MSRFIATVTAIVKDNLSSRFTIFWVVLFPLATTVLFLILFGGLASSSFHVFVSGSGATQLANYIQSQGITVTAVNSPPPPAEGVIWVRLYPNSSFTIYYSPGLKGQALEISALVDSFKQTSLPPLQQYGDVSYQSYLLTGMLGVVALSNGVFGITGVASGYYRDGLIQRLAASPLRDIEWVASLVVYETIVTMISSIAILLLGLILGFVPTQGFEFFLVLITGTLMFSGLGAVVFGLTPKDKLFIAESASTAIIFPLMFLSDALYPLPNGLGSLLAYSPVSVVDDIVRAAVLYGRAPPLYAVGELGVLTVAFLLLGSRLLRLREV